jgi:hypothetical protein
VNKYRDETQPYCNSGQRKAIDDAHISVVSLMSPVILMGERCSCNECTTVGCLWALDGRMREFVEHLTVAGLAQSMNIPPSRGNRLTLQGFACVAIA